MHYESVSLTTIIDRGVTVSSRTPVLDVLDLFLTDLDLRVVPVVDGTKPVGMVNRSRIVEMFSRPYRRDLHRRDPISKFMDNTPIIVNINTDIDDLSQRLISAGLQQMLDGFLVTDSEGCYAGIGNAQNLLGEVTKRKQAHLHQLAHYDALTGLPNRTLFRDRLGEAIEQTRRCGKHLAVGFIDIDNFKRINDTLGHTAGDELLRVAAQRLTNEVRSSDTLARVGGDEFNLLLTNLNEPVDAATVVRKLRQRLAEPITLSEQETVVSASLGIAIFPADGNDMEELIRKADIAMYAAKEAGRDTYCFFDKTHEVFDNSRLYLENELRTAVKNDSIDIAFQGMLDARTGAVRGAEILARWHHPQDGFIPPGTFVPLAEDTGLIAALGRLITGKAVNALKHVDDLSFSINVSAIELRDKEYENRLMKQLEDAEIDPKRVQLELTERLFLEPSDHLLKQLSNMRSRGIRIAIDDFGVGSTSLRVLHALPVDALKIDRSFVVESDHDPRVDALVHAIIEMGHALSLQVVAEGVETPQQAERLRTHGCDILQGYLYCHPTDEDTFLNWLNDPQHNQHTRSFDATRKSRTEKGGRTAGDW